MMDIKKLEKKIEKITLLGGKDVVVTKLNLDKEIPFEFKLTKRGANKLKPVLFEIIKQIIESVPKEEGNDLDPQYMYANRIKHWKGEILKQLRVKEEK